MSGKNAEYAKEYSRIYSRERYAACKENGICVCCGKEDAFKPFVKCPACLEKAAERRIRRRQSWLEHPEKKARYQEKERKNSADRRKKRKEAGVCTICGKRKTEAGTSLCGICREKYRAYGATYRNKRKYLFSQQTNSKKVNHMMAESGI